MAIEAAAVIGVTSVGPSKRKAYYSDYGVERADVSAPGGDAIRLNRPARPENLILAAYPESVGRIEDRDANGTPDIDANGNPTTPAVVKRAAPPSAGGPGHLDGRAARGGRRRADRGPVRQARPQQPRA